MLSWLAFGACSGATRELELAVDMCIAVGKVEKGVTPDGAALGYDGVVLWSCFG